MMNKDMVSNSLKVFSQRTRFLLAIFSILLIPNHFNSYVVSVRAGAKGPQPIVDGLSWNFYKTACPNLESIVRKHMRFVLKPDIGQAAGFLHLYLQDCFQQGCDASRLLRGSSNLRATTLKAISDIFNSVHKECGKVVSCADIITITTRDAIYLSGGPDYAVPLGRRDALGSIPPTKKKTKLSFPPPSSNTSSLLNYFAQLNFDATDVVALSGSHTFGSSHCSAVTFRLHPNIDPTMDPTYAKRIQMTCDASNTTPNSTVVMDIRTPNKFDNKYYVGLLNRQGLFTSDQDLYSDGRTRHIVTSFATNQTLFFEKFVEAVVKMGQLGVLTGRQGEIRSNCSVTGIKKGR